MGGGGFSMGGDGNRAMGRFFHSSRFGFCVGGGGLCLSLMVVAGGWLGLIFSEIDFLHPIPNTKNNFPV